MAKVTHQREVDKALGPRSSAVLASRGGSFTVLPASFVGAGYDAQQVHHSFIATNSSNTGSPQDAV